MAWSTPTVVVVIPARSIRTEPSVYRCEAGQPAREPRSSHGAKAVGAREITETYAVIEAKTAAKTGNGSYVSWRARGASVLQFTVAVPGSRPGIVLARVETKWLRDTLHHEAVRDSILECASTAGLELDPAAVETGLRGVHEAIKDQLSVWRFR